jgi:hypothetical protein
MVYRGTVCANAVGDMLMIARRTLSAARILMVHSSQLGVCIA